MSIALQILCHLWGDYILQNHAMANYKRTSMWWASIHAITYSIPFALLLLFQNYADLQAKALSIAFALSIIAGTHAIIDRYAPHKKWMEWWGIGQPGLIFEKAGLSQPKATAPAFLTVWLTIIVDNTLHFTINALAIFAFGL